MPYIKKEARPQFENSINDLIGNINTPGELNYVISKLLDGYTNKKGLSYGTINETIGVVSCVQSEYYRVVALPYEDNKINENGGVYINQLIDKHL